MAGLRFDLMNSPRMEPKPHKPEVAELLLAPFSRVPKLTFEKVELGKHAVQLVCVKNPGNFAQSVTVATSKGSAELGFSVSINEFNLQPNEEELVEIRYFPLKIGAVKDTISIFSNDTRFKFVIHLSANCIPVQKKVVRKRKMWDVNSIQPPLFMMATESNSEMARTFSVTPCSKVPSLKDHTFCIPPSSVATDGLDSVKNEPSFQDNGEFEDSLEKVNSENKENSTPGKKERRGAFELTFEGLTFGDLTPDRSVLETRRCLSTIENFSPLSSTPLPSQIMTSLSSDKHETKVDFVISSGVSPKDFIQNEELVSPIQKSKSLCKNRPTFRSPPSIHIRKDLFKKASPIGARAVSTIVKVNKTVTSTWTIAASKSTAQSPKRGSCRASVGSYTPGQNKLSHSFSKKCKTALGPTPRMLKKERGGSLSPQSCTPFKKPRSSRVQPPKRSTNATFNDTSSSINPYQQSTTYYDHLTSIAVSDPFARNASYLPEFLEKQTKELIKWVNLVLTPPAEYSAYEAAVNVEELWKKSVSTDTVPLAPSRELICSKYHKDELHLLNLRNAAAALFKSETVAKTLMKLLIKIKSGFLSVKDDIDIHVDQGARYQIIELLMCYNPLWLRIGLEAVYERIILIHANQTALGLMQFIKNHLFYDKDIDQRYSIHNVRVLKKPEFRREMNDFVVYKFFALVFFLDRAKGERIIPYDPCLFNKNAPIKDSETMLNEFIKHFVKCVGQMKRTLSANGYILKYQQTAIDEYKFACQTYIDLRDGASLVRLVEIILKKHNHLVRKLRLPAISRLQKIHNVKLAMEALGNENMTIDNVTPADIVDGHEQKIMSFVWQILFKFLKPRQEKAAITIQTWWRRNQLKLEIERRIRRKHQMVLEQSAVKIQALWRGWQMRKKFSSMKTLLIERKAQHARILAAVKIQQWYRSCLLARRKIEEEKTLFLVKNEAASKIQFWYSRQKRMKMERTTFLAKREASKKIQRWYRSFAIVKKHRTDFLLLLKCTRTIQGRFRAIQLMRKQKSEYKKIREAALKIQMWYRTTSMTKKERGKFLEKREAAKRIQRHWRATMLMWQQKTEYDNMKTATKKIQQWYQATSLMKQERASYLEKRLAVKKIQRHWRATLLMWQQKTEYDNMKEATVKIQRWYRATSLMREERAIYLEKVDAVKKIQCHWKATLLMRQHKAEYKNMKEAALKIQRWYRATSLMKEERARYLAKCEAVKKIQCHWRCTLLMWHLRTEYDSIREATLKIQQWYRATSLMKQERASYLEKRAAVRKIQCHWRATLLMWQEKTEYENIKQATVKIQQWYRATGLMKKERTKYLQKREAVKKIQRHWRATLLMWQQKTEYDSIKEATVKIQRWFRASYLMKEERARYLEKVDATKKIQCHWKATLLMRQEKAKYVNMKEAALKIQSWYRATSLMKQERASYLEKCAAVKKIQRHWRATLLMWQQKTEYDCMKDATLKIQQWYRATSTMNKERAIYLKKVAAVKLIQCHWRATLLMQQHKTEYDNMKVAAVKIQRWYRATSLMNKERASYLKKCKSVKLIQCHWRTTLLMWHQKMEYDNIKEAAVKIQRWYRASSLMKKELASYLEKREAVMKIQSHFRATLLMKQEKVRYDNMKEATLKIQGWYRATSLMNKERAIYLEKVKAAKKIQRYWRAILLTRQEKAEYDNLIEASVKIQRWFRATSLMKKERASFLEKLEAAKELQRFQLTLLVRQQEIEYENRHVATVKIQRWYRAALLMKKERASYLEKLEAAKKIQCHWRAMLHMRQQTIFNLKRNMAATKIQRWYRTKKSRNALVESSRSVLAESNEPVTSVRADQAARTIQTWYRLASCLKKEKSAAIARNQAAVKIQRSYRNYRKKAQAAKNASANRSKPNKPAGPTLSQILVTVEPFFNTFNVKRSLNESYNAFRRLDYITNHAPVLCEKFVNHTKLFEAIYFILDRESRSEAYKVIYNHGLNVLLHLTQYEKTYNTVWECTNIFNGFNVLLILMVKFRDKPEELFCKAATIIWSYSRTPEQIQYLSQSTDILRQLSYLHKKIVVEPLKRGARKPGGNRAGNSAINVPDPKSKKLSRKVFGSTRDAVLTLSSIYKIC